MQFDQVVLAGGGNRCWWQAGFWNVLNEAIPQHPTKIVAVSAGAATACLFSARPGDEGSQWGLNYYAKALAKVSSNVDWKNLFSSEPLFPHYRLYKAALENILCDGFERIQNGPEILIGLAKTPGYLSPKLSVAVGLLAYELEKKFQRPLHPQSGRRLGFSRLFVSSKSCANINELIETILQSSCTPPFTPVMYRDGRAILDGGLIDNVPIDGLTPATSGDKNQEDLVLLTRMYVLPNPLIQEFQGLRLTYIQPSQKVPISSWDYSRHDLMPKAYELGKRDAMLAVTNGIFV
jgi:hypothetical protein